MSIYKAYDIRGIVPDELNDRLAEKIGIVFANLMQEEAGKQDVSIVTANDMRDSGIGLLNALHAGMLKAGANIVHIGLSSTPMFYFAAGFLGVDGGIACTASHNPSKYNGFKMVRAGSRPVSEDSGIREIEKRVAERRFRFGQEQGKIKYLKIFDEYEQKLLSFAQNTDKILRVAVDAANGMAGTYKPILDKLGFDLMPMFFELDGAFPNHEANPLKIENLRAIQTEMHENQYNFGVAFDGDADRVMFLDELGEVIPADIMTALISQTVLMEHAGSAIVYDVRSSRIVPELVKILGGTPVREKVGHSFIKETMRKCGSWFSGEFSGHFYWREMYVSDNALLTVIYVANILRESGKNLSELVKPLKKYFHSGELNFRIENKDEMMEKLAEHFNDGNVNRIDGVSVSYPSWWFNVRPSNTEPYLRLTVEAETSEELSEKLLIIKNILS